jgi:hypothetical protein
MARDQQVHVVGLAVELEQLAAPAATDPLELRLHLVKHLGREASVTVLRHEDNVKL